MEGVPIPSSSKYPSNVRKLVEAQVPKSLRLDELPGRGFELLEIYLRRQQLPWVGLLHYRALLKTVLESFCTAEAYIAPPKLFPLQATSR